MNRSLLEQTFKDRRRVDDVSRKDMQIFQTPILKSGTEAEQLHAFKLWLTFFFGYPLEQLEPHPLCCMAGLLFLAGDNGKAPSKWHIEYLSDRWFKVISPFAKNDGTTSPGGFVSECVLVVDEWREPNRKKSEVIVTSDADSVTMNFDGLKQHSRQTIYEILHHRYGCRIY